MHPTTRIVLYILSALALPGLNFFLLMGLGAFLMLISWPHRGRLWSLLKRARWLFLILILTHAYQLPGESLLPLLGQFSPSHEGVMAGGLQVARLLVMLILLDALVLAMPTDELVSGVFGLLLPFAPLGLDPKRAALRLALTLHAMERRLGSHILHDLLQGRQPGYDLPSQQPLTLMAWHWRDAVILGTALLGVGAMWFNA